ncbi:type II secretion system F family protein [Amedibacterium intestinale]|uniref:type II secretion system F family protein n=2 Tax=Amedibacterium intestinale TaxID=2583452 RepID=UPI000E4E8915|nr:type II secretion system F family protein [Amedibacterium intestinale]RHO28585.1 type II secretion system F family protein [Erysipelotrichaceae bacterium AM17-60]
MKKTLLTNSELANFTSQMALILQAGISPYEGISIMVEDSDNDKTKQFLSSIEELLNQGETLYTSLQQTNAFPAYALHMIQIGELSGRLEEVMRSLSIHYQRQYENNESIKSAVSYPLIMIVMMFVVILVLITKVLPIFNQVFEQLGTSISGFSKAVLDIGKSFSTYSYIYIGILLILLLCFVYFTKSEQGKMKFYDFLTKLRFTKNLTWKLALSKFTSGMSIALSSGLDVSQSMEMAKELIDHKQLKAKITEAEKMLEDHDLATSLIQTNIVSGMYARLLKIGNKTGHTDQIMKEIADRYDQETNEGITRFISIIEPTLVAVLSILVGIILLSVMLPLIGIMATL